MSRNSYALGTLFFDDIECDERFSEGNRGHITIGGDRGDVHAASATNDIAELAGEFGVRLWNAVLLTTLDLTEDEAEEIAREVVAFSYESIQEETFAQSGKE